jgi:alpha-L-fucosidase
MTRFEPTWDSLRRYQVPDWFKKAKFGIFIHWGLYSVPAYDNEWYSRNMYQVGSVAYEHHRETWGDQSKFGYKDFIPLFTARSFDADAWAALFKQSGARYVVPVAEHHDGFAMYDSALTPWNAAQMGPRRDIIGELSEAVRKQDMEFGVSYHRAEHWWFFDGGLYFDSDVQDPANASFYGPPISAPQTTDYGSAEWTSRDWQPRPDAKFLDDWLARCYELVDRYQPQLLYFDWWIEQIVFQPYLQKFAAHYYNRADEWQKGVVLTNKFGAFPEGTAMYDLERGKLNHLREDYWQTDSSVSYKTWCYIEDDELKTTTTLVHDLVDAVSKNANLLLNVGPKADGTFSDEVVQLLNGIGRWLDVNGEAIYDTEHWHVFGEGVTQQAEGHLREQDHIPYTAQDIRYTQRDGAVYAICLGWPGSSTTFQSLGASSPLKAEAIESIQMLGSEQSLAWSQTDESLTVETPSERVGDHAYTFKITLKTT